MFRSNLIVLKLLRMLGYCQLGDGNGSGPKQLDAAKFVVVLFFLMILLVGAAGELPLLFPFLVFL